MGMSAQEKPLTATVVGHGHMLHDVWARQARHDGWRRDADWACPETSELANVVLTGGNAADAVRALARHRAAQGVGIHEALSDLCSLFAVHRPTGEQELLLTFAESWVDASHLFTPAISCTDPGSGLASQYHFERRVLDVYAEDPAPHLHHLLATIRHPLPNRAVLPGWAVTAEIGALALRCLTGSTAMHRGDRIVVLLRRSEAAFHAVHRTRAELDALLTGHGCTGGRVHLDLEPLPPRAGDATRLLGSLWR